MKIPFPVISITGKDCEGWAHYEAFWTGIWGNIFRRIAPKLTSPIIKIHPDRGDFKDQNLLFAQTLLAIDHEWTHHILLWIVGSNASEGFDRLAGDLLGHSDFTGMSLIYRRKS